MSKIICQLYGFRKEIAKDPFNCFQKIKDMGFDWVQLDGFRGRTPQEIKEALDKSKLKVSSMHIKHSRFINDVEGIIDECRYFNCQEIYLKYIDDEFQVESGYKFTKHCLIKATKILNKYGIEVGFHSPEYDFNTLIDNQKVMEYICSTSEVKILYEPDTYWLTVAKEDPLAFIQKYPDQIQTIHLKDIDTSQDLMDMHANIRECGRGGVDFKSIIAWGIKQGIKNYAIEQDYSSTDIYDSFKVSLNYIQTIMKELEN